MILVRVLREIMSLGDIWITFAADKDKIAKKYL